jgi:hypothetical protein
MAKQKPRLKRTLRGYNLKVRLSPSEKEHVERCAAARNITVSEYARLALILGRIT